MKKEWGFLQHCHCLVFNQGTFSVEWGNNIIFYDNFSGLRAFAENSKVEEGLDRSEVGRGGGWVNPGCMFYGNTRFLRYEGGLQSRLSSKFISALENTCLFAFKFERNFRQNKTKLTRNNTVSMSLIQTNLVEN